MEILSQQANAIPDRATSIAFRKVMEPFYGRMRSMGFSSAGLVISSTTTKVKTGASDWYGIAAGKLQKVTAGTDMPALVGTVTNGKFNAFVFFIDKAGTVYSQMMNEGATLNAVTFKSGDDDMAVLGFVIINPTGTGNFVGGTTPLGDGTVVPNAVYINTLSAFEPTATI